MKYKLICADIDGTLLDNKKNIPFRVKQSLQDAADQGIRIALVSGRMPSGVDLVEKELGICCMKACNAGSYILADGRCIGTEYLSNHIMRKMSREIAEPYGIPLWIFRHEEWFVTAIDERVEQEIGFVSYQPKLVNVKALSDQWDREEKCPNKLLVAADPKMIQEIYHKMKQNREEWKEIDMACSDDTFLEIFPKGANKGQALRTICRELGIQPEETIAFGDHELDIPLIETAGVGVAMGNAILALKEKADMVTKTNNEGGIAYALEELLTG